MKPRTRCVWLIVIGLVCCRDHASLAQMRAEREEIARFSENITVSAADMLDTAVAIGGSITVLSGGQVTQ